MTWEEIYEKTTGNQNKISVLSGMLSSNQSEYGDWKIIKIYEARMKGEEDPYDFDELVAQRQTFRSMINELQEKIAAGDDGMPEGEM